MEQKIPTAKPVPAEARRPERDRRARRAAQRNVPKWRSDAPAEAADLLSFPAGGPLANGGRRRK